MDRYVSRPLRSGVRGPDGGAAPAPLDEQRVGQVYVVGVEAGPAQELEDVAGAEGAAEDFAVHADAAAAWSSGG
ncbi:hypothetical protein AB0469_26155 [Streptomyces sp. NPDC093801]|uniref:hypothetical protein n=1 Tax=Streptomyces sp. NPDC093801 TaxID=3155203 RepID=UPI00344B3678